MPRPIALVTGGSRNIGWAVVQLFAPTHEVVIADLEAPREPMPDHVRWRALDVRDYPACERLLEQVGEAAGIDALVHCAAITAPATPIAALDPAEWSRVIDVNLNGSFHVMRAAVASLRRARGCAVLVSSRAARVGYAALAAPAAGTKPHYCASKAGVVSLMRSLALELAADGVRVNCVAPGSIEGEMIPRERWPEISAKVPMGRMGRADEVAQACRFLCSPAASYITGHVLDVNGGTWMN